MCHPLSAPRPQSRGPKVEDFEIPRESDTGRDIELPDEGDPPHQGASGLAKRGDGRSGGFYRVLGKPLLLAGVIFNPPNTAGKIKGAF
jgi:hypothetical protein